MKKRRLLSLLLVLVLVIGTLTTAGCGKKEEEKSGELPVLRVAIQPYLCSLPVVYMMENGLDEANGFKIEPLVFTVGTLMIESLVADEWDVATMGASGASTIANNGAIMIGDIELCSGGTGVFVNADSPVAQTKGYNPNYPDVYGTPETVKGLTVACPTGGLNHLAVLKWLEVLGLEPGDIEIVNMDNASGYQALKARQADVTSCSPPLCYNMIDEGFTKVAGMVEVGDEMYDWLVANGDSYKDPKTYETMVKFVKVFYETCDILAGDLEATAQMELKFQTDNGMDSKIENVRKEVEARKFLTTDRLKENEIGATMKKLAEFYVTVDKMEEADLAKFNDETITMKVINDAFGWK